MSHETNTLIKRAYWHWRRGYNLPIDLYMEMTDAGLDPDVIQEVYERRNEDGKETD